MKSILCSMNTQNIIKKKYCTRPDTKRKRTTIAKNMMSTTFNSMIIGLVSKACIYGMSLSLVHWCLFFANLSFISSHLILLFTLLAALAGSSTMSAPLFIHAVRCSDQLMTMSINLSNEIVTQTFHRCFVLFFVNIFKIVSRRKSFVFTLVTIYAILGYCTDILQRYGISKMHLQNFFEAKKSIVSETFKSILWFCMFSSIWFSSFFPGGSIIIGVYMNLNSFQWKELWIREICHNWFHALSWRCRNSICGLLCLIVAQRFVKMHEPLVCFISGTRVEIHDDAPSLRKDLEHHLQGNVRQEDVGPVGKGHKKLKIKSLQEDVITLELQNNQKVERDLERFMVEKTSKFEEVATSKGSSNDYSSVTFDVVSTGVSSSISSLDGDCDNLGFSDSSNTVPSIVKSPSELEQNQIRYQSELEKGVCCQNLKLTESISQVTSEVSDNTVSCRFGAKMNQSREGTFSNHNARKMNRIVSGFQ